jgi:8-oxo-dGTP diphosphatase
MYAFAGILNKEVELKKELNDLEWVSLEDDFSNSDKYAGNGNIETMIAAFLQNIEKFE